MRIIGGSLRGKKIFEPLDILTRPLKNIVRESIFNIIEHSKNEKINLKNANVLDLFSGTGSFGLECLSRGAKKVFFCENHKNSIKILNKNIKSLGLVEQSRVIEKSAYDLNKSLFNLNNFELIFLDPPFKDDNLNNLIETISSLKIINDKSHIIIHRNKKIQEKISNKFIISREKIFGLSKILFGKIN